MSDHHQTINHEEPFLQQEIIMGFAIAVGILLMVVSQIIGILVVLLGVLSAAGIYGYRVYETLREKKEVVFCCYSWLNNASMILAVTGILMLMLMNAHHRLIFYIGLGILGATMLVNLLFRLYKLQGAMLLIAQIRLLIALVLLLVFFLL
jgi:hypothetical protein